MNQALKEVESELSELQRQNRVMVNSLRRIAGNRCDRLTTGPGSCWQHYQRDAKDGADRWCDACVALKALSEVANK